ncbi:elicitin-like protein [Phytophthora infestans T30-4]|uniref:Elicitin-like protein n=1 Tax=Phytophthora infestans (strain T30-4) TaxID=403677 RepID=D0P230_PHYIT|nr:elicitin-like protein [Phytophthora infestans T30-4]EEY55453.1 elicitin-like protein [Phytophthora infestans T30-4]|eukprot:XP_002895647.1 elicitin-like protein [Phytophthora infestans T30-4]
MTELASTIPNCTSSGLSTSEKDQLLRSLDICATPAPTPASTASTINCTSAEAEATFNASYEAANGTCASSTNMEQYSIIIDTECTSPCAQAVRDFAHTLPSCYYRLSNENTNKKQDIATQFSYCETLSNATNISIYADSVDNLLGSTAGVATSCVKDASICAYNIHVNTDCDSPCGRRVRRLRYDLVSMRMDRQPSGYFL